MKRPSQMLTSAHRQILAVVNSPLLIHAPQTHTHETVPSHTTATSANIDCDPNHPILKQAYLFIPFSGTWMAVPATNCSSVCGQSEGPPQPVLCSTGNVSGCDEGTKPDADRCPSTNPCGDARNTPKYSFHNSDSCHLFYSFMHHTHTRARAKTYLRTQQRH